MKSHKNILIAFVLNFGFSIFEFIGGTITGSIAIISDSVHDIGDAMSIGLSYFLEKKSKKMPDDKYTYGYVRYSVVGSLITNIILVTGSIFVILNALNRIINPININYNGMIIFAVIGAIVNFFAAYFTKDGYSLNQKAVNLHMLEDVLGWIIVLVGALIMRITDIRIIDPILSILVTIFIFINSIKNLKLVLDLFLEKTPKGISIKELRNHILKIDGVNDVHHIHIWSIDGYNSYATMHIVTNNNNVRGLVKQELKKYGIVHSTIELEDIGEKCADENCFVQLEGNKHHHH